MYPFLKQLLLKIIWKNNPNGKYVKKAKEKIEELKWLQADAANTIDAYTEYLSEYPEGKMADYAKELIEWKSIEDTNSLAAFVGYLKKYPKGEFKYAADNRIEQLTWEKALNQNRKYDYERYLEKYPNGIFTEEAKEFISEKEAEEREYTAWNSASGVNSIQAYIDYLTQYPNGKYSEQALNELEAKTICESCKGNGKCSICNGSGKYGTEYKLISYDQCKRTKGYFGIYHGKKCKVCGGDGKVNEKYGYVDADCKNCYDGTCRKCDGTGHIQIKWLTEWYANR